MLGDRAAARAAIVEALGLVDEADNWSGVERGTRNPVDPGVGPGQARASDATVRVRPRRSVARSRVGSRWQASEVTGTDVLADARKAIGDEAVDRALAEGRSMSRAEAVAYARDDG